MDLTRAIWKKASYSTNNGNCVEVAMNLPGVVAIRDSKNPDAPALVVSREDWESFTSAIKSGAYEE